MYSCRIQKFLRCGLNHTKQLPLVITIQKGEVSLHIYVREGERSFFLHYLGQKGKNVPILLTTVSKFSCCKTSYIKIFCHLWDVYGQEAQTANVNRYQRTPTFLLHYHSNEPYYLSQTILMLLCINLKSKPIVLEVIGSKFCPVHECPSFPTLSFLQLRPTTIPHSGFRFYTRIFYHLKLI